MKCEFEIHQILASNQPAELKVKSICKFMTWNKAELTYQINKYNTYSQDGILGIIGHFWG